MKKFTILTSVLALGACGGGSGGGGTSDAVVTPNSIVIPNNIYNVDSDTGLGMVDINTTRSAKVHQAIRIAQSIEGDNTGIDYGASIARKTSKPMIGKSGFSNITEEDITKSYETMRDIFVNHNYTNYTNHDVLVALALIYMDKTKILELLGNENNKLDEKIDNLIDGLNDGDDFAKDAQSIYQDFGKNFDLTLKDAVFYHNGNDTNYYTFKFDEDGNITHLEEQDGHLYKKAQNGVFENDTMTGNTVSFDHSGQANNHDFHVQVNIDYDSADYPSDTSTIRAALIQKVEYQYGVPEAELNAAAEWINNADIINFGDTCNNTVNGCIKISNFNHRERVRIETGSKDLGLRYSDFGLRFEEIDIYDGDSELAEIGLPYYLYKEHGGFVGGYEDKKATPESGMVFKGDSYVGLTRKLSNEQIQEIMNNGGSFPSPENNYYKGTATVTVNGDTNNLNQQLVADFSKAGWYEVTVDNMPVNGHGGDFSFDAKGNEIDEKWQVHQDTHNGIMENSNIKYYGPESDKATEAVGFVQYIEDKKNDADWTFKADITYGAKLDQ